MVVKGLCASGETRPDEAAMVRCQCAGELAGVSTPIVRVHASINQFFLGHAARDRVKRRINGVVAGK